MDFDNKRRLINKYFLKLKFIRLKFVLGVTTHFKRANKIFKNQANILALGINFNQFW